MTYKNYSYDESDPSEDERDMPEGWWIAAIGIIGALALIALVIVRWA